MKIGILTFHRAHNYGALLQAYALLTYIKSLGHNVEIIDYWPDYHNEDYKLIPYFKAKTLKGKIKSLLLFIIGFQRIIKRSNGYKQFIKEKFNLSKKPQYTYEKGMLNAEYDLVIYGSDQIWRRSNYPLFKGFSDVYYGAYPTSVNQKITYAASMGIIDISNEEKTYIKTSLKNFNSISVREKKLKELIESFTNNPVSLVLDPVFLLSKSNWSELSIKTLNKYSKKYILFYQLNPSKEAIDLTNEIKAYYGYDVVEIRGRVEPLLFQKRYYQTGNPTEFISLVNNAEIVVSTSFHGVAFSILFEKQFYTLGMNNNSERVRSLLDQLGISNRFIKNNIDIDYSKGIDYSSVNAKLEVLKKESQNYLIKAIKNVQLNE